MKTNSNLFVKMSRSAMLVLTALAAFTTTGRACNFELWVYPKNGPDAALVLPGSNLGGRVAWSSQHGCYVTDRVVRGEKLFAFLSPGTPAERNNPAIYRANVHSDGNGQTFAIWATSTLTAIAPIPGYPYGLGITGDFRIPDNASWDNDYIQIWTANSLGNNLPCRYRIPIGGRP